MPRTRQTPTPPPPAKAPTIIVEKKPAKAKKAPSGSAAARQGTPDELAFAQSVLRAEAAAVADLAASLGPPFTRAVDLIVKCAESGGTVQVSGLGKSGHVGAKISATLASLGIPSHPVHPSEAAHGDLGRFRPTDLAVCISFSGETHEVVNLAAILKQDGVPIISITGDAGAKSSLARLATTALTLPITHEAGAPQFVAPTSSTTATLALGDALALAAARRRNFTNHDFAKRHPGGSLGGLLRPVTDVMRWRVTPGKSTSAVLPVVDARLTVLEALKRAEAVGRRPGAMVLVDHTSGALAGIFTDGDLRRLIQRDAAAVARPISEVMTRSPRTLPDSAMVSDAVRLIREFRQDEIPIVDSRGRPVGMLDVQDLIAMRLVEDHS
ncbi:MAG TPA: KpsF/GutQ family sugar-phosphate isomerase [Phycisphaerales bacterium]|nr:KpsF/GutQ family sugar-phosphate isomerase [Phycisphaerales bacterium]